MKRIVAFALSVIMVLSLTSCGKKVEIELTSTTGTPWQGLMEVNDGMELHQWLTTFDGDDLLLVDMNSEDYEFYRPADEEVPYPDLGSLVDVDGLLEYKWQTDKKQGVMTLTASTVYGYDVVATYAINDKSLKRVQATLDFTSYDFVIEQFGISDDAVDPGPVNVTVPTDPDDPHTPVTLPAPDRTADIARDFSMYIFMPTHAERTEKAIKEYKWTPIRGGITRARIEDNGWQKYQRMDDMDWLSNPDYPDLIISVNDNLTEFDINARNAYGQLHDIRIYMTEVDHKTGEHVLHCLGWGTDFKEFVRLFGEPIEKYTEEYITVGTWKAGNWEYEFTFHTYRGLVELRYRFRGDSPADMLVGEPIEVLSVNELEKLLYEPNYREPMHMPTMKLEDQKIEFSYAPAQGWVDWHDTDLYKDMHKDETVVHDECYFDNPKFSHATIKRSDNSVREGISEEKQYLKQFSIINSTCVGNRPDLTIGEWGWDLPITEVVDLLGEPTSITVGTMGSHGDDGYTDEQEVQYLYQCSADNIELVLLFDYRTGKLFGVEIQTLDPSKPIGTYVPVFGEKQWDIDNPDYALAQKRDTEEESTTGKET